MVLIWAYLVLVYISKAHHIICEGENACKSQTIQCPVKDDCLVQCQGAEACRDVTITCPIGYACDLICYNAEQMDTHTNMLTCYGMVIDAKQSTALRLWANIGKIEDEKHELQTLEEVTVHCPQYAGDKSCQIFCNGNDLINKWEIYAVSGFKDLSITSTKACIKEATVHCTNNFSHNCVMTNFHPFECQKGTDKTCETYTLSPTYTYYPTLSPTNDPISSSSSPIQAPTNNPTKYQILLPEGTNNPSVSPTFTKFKPTISSTNNPTSQTENPLLVPNTTNSKSAISPTASNNLRNVFIAVIIAVIIIIFISAMILNRIKTQKTLLSAKTAKTMHQQQQRSHTYSSVSDGEYSDTHEVVSDGEYNDTKSVLDTQLGYSTEIQTDNESSTERTESESDEKNENQSSSHKKDTISIPIKIFPQNHKMELHRRSNRKLLETYNFEEISKHCTHKSCWIVVDNLVLDVTKFLKYHPGDIDSITKYGGTVCDEHFAFHSNSGKQLFWKFVIGKVDSKNVANCIVQ